MNLSKKIDYEAVKKGLKDSRIITGITLFVFVTVMFTISVIMRSEYMNNVSFDHHNHLTATAVAFTNNWLDDGIIKDHFAMIPNPASVEFPTLKDRSFYDSYPSGCIVPLYLLAKLTFRENITFGFVQRWNLFNQYAITLLLAFLVYILFIKIKQRPFVGFIAAIIPTVINLFMSAPFYFFHSVYFSDQAVLLPFIVTVFIEMLWTWSSKDKTKKYLNIFEAIVIFVGTSTDYLYLCVLPVIYAKRIILGEIPVRPVKEWLKTSLKLAAPAIISVLLFILQLAINGPVRIIDMFVMRTGIKDTTGWTEVFKMVFWDGYIVSGYGPYANTILKASLALMIALIVVYFILRRYKQYKNDGVVWTLSAAAMIIIPCFMQVYLLRNHSAVHDFSVLKFSLVMSVVPYVLLPSAIIQLCASKGGKKAVSYSLTAAIITFAVFSCFNTHYVYHETSKDYFPAPSEEVIRVAGFIKGNTNYNDVVFTEDYDIEDTNGWPAKIALAKKRIYKEYDINAIYDKVKDISDDYTINIFSVDGPVDGPLKGLSDKAYNIIQDGDMHLYKISKADFLNIFN